MKVYTNQTNIYEGSTAVAEHKDRDQAVSLSIVKSFILCGHQAYETHIKSMEAKDRFTTKCSNTDMMHHESGMSFLQVKLSMTNKKKLRQVRRAICVNRREIAHTHLEAVAGTGNLYSLITILGRGHLTNKACGQYTFKVCSRGSNTQITQTVQKKSQHCKTEHISSWTLSAL